MYYQRKGTHKYPAQTPEGEGFIIAVTNTRGSRTAVAEFVNRVKLSRLQLLVLDKYKPDKRNHTEVAEALEISREQTVGALRRACLNNGYNPPDHRDDVNAIDAKIRDLQESLRGHNVELLVQQMDAKVAQDSAENKISRRHRF